MRMQLNGFRSLSQHGLGRVTCSFGALSIASAFAFAGSAATHDAASHSALRVPVHVVDELDFVSTVYATGEQVVQPSQIVWRPVCGSDPSVVSSELLETMARSHAELVATTPSIVVDSPGSDANLNLVYNVSGSIPSGALAAIASAEAYIESFYTDPITITVSLSFANLGSGVLGGTGSSYVNVAWSSARTGLVNGMDANDTIQTSLPSGSTIPVRYGSGSTITNETRVFFTRGNYKATIGSATGTDASMQYNNAFAWDFDPSNGITGGTYSFIDVVIHETGHAMGFTSGIDFRFNDIEAIDIYRFQRTDGSADYNPDTLAEFTARPRLAAFNSPNDAHNFDNISVEYRYSDGSPWQASHFREQSPNIGLMDPAFASGETWFPGYYSTADVTVFDAIGYDR